MKENLYELTNPQKLIWDTEQYYSNTNINNISGYIMIHEVVHLPLIKEAINLYIKKNDSFRLKIALENSVPKQYISSYEPFDIETISISKDELNDYAKQLTAIPFEMLDHSLYKFKLFCFPDSTCAIYISVHHIIADAWTMGLYISELMDLYSALVHGDFVSEETNLSYLNYIESENDYMKSQKFLKDQEFWLSTFDDEPIHSSIVNYEKTGISSIAKRKPFTLDSSIYASILEFCQNHKCSIYTFLMSIYFLYISKVNNHMDHAVMGTPILNRTNYAEKNTTGMFISMVPFTVNVPADHCFLDFISSVSTTQMSIFRHQKYPFQSILENYRKHFNTVQSIYEVSLSYQNVRDNKNNSSIDYSTEWLFNGNISDGFQIHIYDMDNTGFLTIYYDYQTSKFQEIDIESIHHRILYMIRQILSNPEIPLSCLKILPPDEEHKIMTSFNNSTIVYPRDTTIHELIDSACDKYPDSYAVTDSSNSITYSQLKEWSDYIAYHLIKLGVKPNDCIAVLFKKKKIDSILSILGILKAGAYFLPIYSGYPDERISYLLHNSQSKFLLTESCYLNQFDCTNALLIDSLKMPIDPCDLPKIPVNQTAYTIYTSGSTGSPKGTLQSHDNLVNFVYSFQYFLDNTITNIDRFLSVTNVCFDVSIAEIFTPLCFGARLYLYQDLNNSTIEKLGHYITQNQISFSYFPPAILLDVYEELSQYSSISLNKLLVGVEPIKASTLKKFYLLNPNMKIVNGYGPSETTICCTMYPFNSSLESNAITPIGTPIGNSKIHILDKHKEPVPINTIGEIFVEGTCVGNGYLNQPEMTQKSFSNLGTVSKTYRTGDLARWSYDGTISFIGRNDNQVKYRGYRIDLGEIENTFKSFDFIKNALILLDTTAFQTNTLVAFLIMDHQTINENYIRELLSKKLPHYMIPNHIVFVDSFPLTTNGKIDRKSLIENYLIKRFSSYQKPTGEIQVALAKLFEQIFKKTDISIHDNFFELGGDSLTAMKIVSLSSNYNLSLTAQDFYTYPTIDLLSKKLNQGEKIAHYENDYLTSYPFEKETISSLQGDILLTGTTGFLGIHLLKDLLEQTPFTIFCLIRGSSLTHSTSRLIDRLHYYFGSSLDSYLGSRIKVINGDFTMVNLGLDELLYDELLTKVKTVFNSAALVKHVGNESLFKEFNVLSVKHLIDFCQQADDCSLVHISTLSISSTNTNSQLTLSERDLYVGQDMDHTSIYVKTKFDAEKLIYENIEKGLKATVFRLGNITWRFSDGKYQYNENENLFFNVLKIIMDTKVIPASMQDLSFNISPVDFCSKSIISILTKNNLYNTYHIFNDNVLTIKDIINILNIDHRGIETIDDLSYKKIINQFISKNDIYSLIDNYFVTKSSYDTLVDSSLTKSVLKSIDFEWPILTLGYFNLLLRRNEKNEENKK